jgi:hypothetical protein
LRVADILGKRVTQIYPDTEDTDLIEIYGRVALTGEPVTFERFYKLRQRRYDINVYQVGKGRFATVFEDITDRQPQERADARAEKRRGRMGGGNEKKG